MSDVAQTKTGFIRVCGGNLRYELAGEGPTLVLIHAGLADCRMFDDQLAFLSQHCQVLRYDLHGFGRSSWPDQPYTHHESLHELLDHLDIDRVSLLGTSLGGGVALDFTLTYPEMVDSLIAVSAGIGGYPQKPEDELLFQPVIEAFTANEYTRAIDLMIHIWVDGPSREPDQVSAELRERIRALYTDVLLRTREGGRQADQLEPSAYRRLDDIHVPTLVIVGSEDISGVRDQAEWLSRSIDGSRKEEISGVAHMLNMEVPEQFNQLVLQFLQEHQLAR